MVKQKLMLATVFDNGNMVHLPLLGSNEEVLQLVHASLCDCPI